MIINISKKDLVISGGVINFVVHKYKNTYTMKKILMVAIILIASVSTFAQATEIEKKVIQVFQTVYVEKTFKDPYSFKLLKIIATPITFGQWIQNDISYLKDALDNGKNLYEPREESLKRKEKYETDYSQMSDDKKNTVKCYEIKLDCYGNNSLGNPILGRYSFNYFPNADYSKQKLNITKIN
jgi:hypothetical protein